MTTENSTPDPDSVDPNAAPATNASPQTPPESPPDPYAVFPTEDHFNRRLDQATRARMRKEFGTEDPAEIKAKLAQLDAMAQAEAERKKAEMTEIQKAQAEAQEAQARAAAAEEAAAQATFSAHVASLCAARGIRDLKMARNLIRDKADEIPEGEQLDEGAYLDELLAQDRWKAALDVAAPVVATQTPANTTPAPGQRGPGAAPQPSPPKAPVTNANEMSAEQFQAHIRSIGG